MSSKKRSGIGGFWDSVAPPADEPQSEVVEQPALKVMTSPKAPPPREEPVHADVTPEVSRPRGRPPSTVQKERMTVNLSSRSVAILESLRYQARMEGRRNKTFSDLLDEALGLLAKHYDLPESNETKST